MIGFCSVSGVFRRLKSLAAAAAGFGERTWMARRLMIAGLSARRYHQPAAAARAHPSGGRLAGHGGAFLPRFVRVSVGAMRFWPRCRPLVFVGSQRRRAVRQSAQQRAGSSRRPAVSVWEGVAPPDEDVPTPRRSVAVRSWEEWRFGRWQAMGGGRQAMGGRRWAEGSEGRRWKLGCLENGEDNLVKRGQWIIV